MEKKISINEKIFVAGANGMAGKAICRILHKYNYGLEEFQGKILTPSRKDLNLLDTEAVKNWFKKHKPTVVIIAAARVGGIYANSTQPASFILDNIKIQTNLIESSWIFGVKRLLFLGSSCIYPKFSDQPIQEESLLKGSLESTNENYAIAKICGIKLCEALRSQYKFDAISLMPTNLYGPGDNYHPKYSHVMAALIKRFCDGTISKIPSILCWGSGNPLREFMHVDDLGEAVVFVLENWDPESKNSPKDNKGNPLTYLNVGTGKEISIRNLSEKIAKAAGFKGDITWDQTKPDGTPRKLLDTTRINKMGWFSKKSLKEGIDETIKCYYKDNNL